MGPIRIVRRTIFADKTPMSVRNIVIMAAQFIAALGALVLFYGLLFWIVV